LSKEGANGILRGSKSRLQITYKSRRAKPGVNLLKVVKKTAPPPKPSPKITCTVNLLVLSLFDKELTIPSII